MKDVPDNLEHRIQLKQDEIANYELRIANYPPERLEISGKRYLQKLNNELTILQNELNQKEIKPLLGYSRIGLKNT